MRNWPVLAKLVSTRFWHGLCSHTHYSFVQNWCNSEEENGGRRSGGCCYLVFFLALVWFWRRHAQRHSTVRARDAAARRRMATFRWLQEDELALVTTITTRWLLFGEIRQRRSLWICLQRNHLVRMPLSVEERVAITLWRLGTTIEYQSLGHLFGVGLSNVWRCTWSIDYYCWCTSSSLHKDTNWRRCSKGSWWLFIYMLIPIICNR